jgi:hypothetical protein
MTYFMSYDSERMFAGFYNDESVCKAAGCSYTQITEKDHDQMCCGTIDISKPVVDNNGTVSLSAAVSEGSATTKPDSNGLLAKAEEFSSSGLPVKLSDGTVEHFGWPVSVREILSECFRGQHGAFLSPEGGTIKFYSAADTTLIYKALFNNQVYNYLYSRILYDWSVKNKTSAAYGYADDAIIQELEEDYEQQKIS